jgi:hypothetical protein
MLGVCQRITELMAENANRAQMSREELLTFYAAVIRTPADQVPAGSPVIQSYEVTESGHKIRICDKAAAGAQLAKMCNWNAPERVELGTDSLSTYILQLRQQPIGGGPILPLERNVTPIENGGNGEESRGRVK